MNLEICRSIWLWVLPLDTGMGWRTVEVWKEEKNLDALHAKDNLAWASTFRCQLWGQDWWDLRLVA